MFGGGDPFGNPFQHMHRQMREMDQMMNAMMGSNFGLGMFPHQRQHPQQMMLDNQQHRHQPQNAMMSPFGGGLFGGIMQHMEHMQDHAMNDPNSVMFSQSTMISFGRDGQPKVVHDSTRKVGEVKENRRKVQHGADLTELQVGHSIGDRSHIIEKKRDKDGRFRQTQKFVNLDQHEAEQFNEEFKSRATQNLTGGSSGRPYQPAIGPSASTAAAPIVTVPDDDEEDEDVVVLEERTHRNGQRHREGGYRSDGPTIREISDEEAEKQEAPKRRKGLFGKFV